MITIMEKLRISENHVNQVAKLHKNLIKTGFLSQLGEKFLSVLYSSMVTSPNAFCIVAIENGRVIGFISGAISVRKFYKEFVSKNFFEILVLLIIKMIQNPIVLIRALETAMYSGGKHSLEMPEAELLSVAVDKNYHGKGVSKVLFEELVKEFRRRGVKKFKVVVGEPLIRAQKYYEKLGGRFIGEIEVHKGTKSKVYEWEI